MLSINLIFTKKLVKSKGRIMKLNKLSSIIGAALALSAAAFSSSALADAQAVTAGNAAANLDFQVTIPRTLSFRVGTNTAGTIDRIQFAPTAAQVGSGTALAGTGGDLTAGVVTASVIGNNGQITITPTTLGALNNGGTGTIAWTEIKTAAAVNTATFTLLAAPTLANGTGTAVTPTVTANVTKADAKWTYTYANTTVPQAGTYGGTNTRNSRVTYTAAMP